MRNIEITNSMDIIDSRDVIARIEELEADRESLVGFIVDAREAVDPDVGDAGEHDALEYAKTTLASGTYLMSLRNLQI
jgi:hypothetical protein